jgi:ubiquinone/menaquinone biosynthesis C-methylase UbiE
MQVLFDEKIARSYDRWAETPQGRKAYGLEGELLLKLGDLAVGQSVLEVGCGTGAHLNLFLREGMHVIGVDISPPMLRAARQKLGKNVQLLLGDAENLPFREKSFDCVTLITTLEFVSDPGKAVQEALRICRGKVLLGVLNMYSFLGISRRLKGIFRPSIFNRARFYSIWKLKRLVTKAVPKAIVDWASVLVLPMSWQQYCPGLERWLSFRKNPLGAFLGMKVLIKEA